MDELTTTTTSQVSSLEDGKIVNFSIDPEEYGIAIRDPKELTGGTPQENAQALSNLLDAEPGAYRDIVVLNAGAALLIAQKATDLAQGIEMAKAAIDNGNAKAALAKLVAASNRQ